MNIKEKFGIRVKYLREQKGYSIEHLANVADVDRNYLSAIEKGKRNCSLEIQEKLILSLECNISDFFNHEIFKNESK